MPMFLDGLCISWGLVNGLQWHGCELPLKAAGLPAVMWPGGVISPVAVQTP